ncbi:Uncharacterised protein (plasmid) [Legionella adelaidensis]|uniref:Uncharacterized protein n=1 Tax=Legionella adelaidensis TaxID=45056 RepID=A0A0W0R0S1_9GAMM|nr:hypothetical protein [Legionella adelaidensis]KTC64691.1 hypothetical protein Lade_1985 [Legionella adelaidensis]VEH86159.1 Uncharacterised protein [Legionella adelaidensis]
MGGYGSGKHWYHDSKPTINNYRFIDIRRWSREKVLISNNKFSRQWLSDGKIILFINVEIAPDRNYLIVRWQNPKEKKEPQKINYVIDILWEDCHFGGQRPWFICPLKKCGRRVAILYGGPIFACRHCYKLVYQSQREGVSDRAIRKAEKIRARLKWNTGILEGTQDKPKGMHWRTYERLCKLHDIYTDIFLKK